MSKRIRWITSWVAILILVMFASSDVAWASFSPQAVDSASAPDNVQSVSNDRKGTVRPPNCEGLAITESGDYPLCGIAIIDVEFTTAEDVQLVASLDSIIPPGAGKVMAGPVVIGCLVDGVSDPGPHNRHANIKICFAAHPKNKSVIKFYDEATGTWTSLETTLEGGKACAIVNYSGRYVLVKK